MINQLIPAIEKSLGPVFEYFLAALEKQDGQILDIRLTVKENDVKLEYGIAPIDES
jgi:hypothetical protein